MQEYGCLVNVAPWSMILTDVSEELTAFIGSVITRLLGTKCQNTGIFICENLRCHRNLKYTFKASYRLYCQWVVHIWCRLPVCNNIIHASYHDSCAPSCRSVCPASSKVARAGVLLTATKTSVEDTVIINPCSLVVIVCPRYLKNL